MAETIGEQLDRLAQRLLKELMESEFDAERHAGSPPTLLDALNQARAAASELADLSKTSGKGNRNHD